MEIQDYRVERGSQGLVFLFKLEVNCTSVDIKVNFINLSQFLPFLQCEAAKNSKNKSALEQASVISNNSLP